MVSSVLLTAILVSFAPVLLFVPLVRHIARRKGWVDKPDRERKLHKRPTPNVGGLAIAAGFGVGLVALFGFQEFFSFELVMPKAVVLIGAVIMVGTGFYDDTRGLGFKLKFVIQVAVAYLLVLGGYRFEVGGLPFVDADPVLQALLSAPLTMLWIVGIINAVNLLDGLDGLATGVSIIAFACLTLIFGMQGEAGFMVMTLLMIGALAGFLVYNFNPASIFMGDSGSLFIGYMVAVYTLEGKAHVDPLLAILVPVMALGLPVLDTTLCIVRRLIAGKSPFSPDSDHIHHRLVRLWSTRQAVLVLYAAALWFGAAALLMMVMDPPYTFAVVGGTLLASFIGMRTLGYLDISKQGLRRVFGSERFAFELEWGMASSAQRNGSNGAEVKEQDAHEGIVAGSNGHHATEHAELLEMGA